MVNIITRAIGFVQRRIHTSIIKKTVEVHSSAIFSISSCCFKEKCHLKIGEDSMIEGKLMFDKSDATISIGNRVFFSGTIVAAKQIDIGDDVMISWGVTITDHNSHSLISSERLQDVLDWRVGKKDWSNVKMSPVKICDKAWIGFNSIILKGVTIGEGSIVGAGSVVTKSVPPWTIVGGNPARVIREIPLGDR